jgi:hypothetical protein
MRTLHLSLHSSRKSRPITQGNSTKYFEPSPRYEEIYWLISKLQNTVFFFSSCCSHLEHRASLKCFVSLQFLNVRQSVGLLGRETSPSQGRYLTQTSMPWVGFEPTIPVFERAKTFHALDRAASVIGAEHSSCQKNNLCIIRAFHLRPLKRVPFVATVMKQIWILSWGCCCIAMWSPLGSS